MSKLAVLPMMLYTPIRCKPVLIVDMGQRKDNLRWNLPLMNWADALHMDPCELRFMNIVGENEIMSQYYNEHLNSCALDRCLKKAMEMIGWKEKQLCQ